MGRRLEQLEKSHIAVNNDNSKSTVVSYTMDEASCIDDEMSLSQAEVSLKNLK